jgi:dTDP-4-amino-4,6-dideoxygalactose transaminase
LNVPILRIPFSDESTRFIHEGIDQILASGYLTQGPQTARWEQMFAEFTGAKHAVACSNGTAALELILRGLGIEGRSVIVPTNTFLATALAAMHAGNRVVFADSDPETLALDLADVERKLTPDVAAVILVHIGGIIPGYVGAMAEACRARGVHLLEDCAHAHGSTIGGRQAGTLGTAAGFSFFPTKVLTTGEGGMVTTDDDALADRVRKIRNQGKDPALANHISEAGLNYRVSELTALVGVQQMMHAQETIADRQRAAAHYDQALADMPGIRAVILPTAATSSYYKYIAYLDEGIDRAALKKTMREKYGVALTGEVYADLCHNEPLWERFTYCGRDRSHRPVACHRFPGCGCSQRQAGFPGADYISKNHVCLPVYPGLTDAELDHVTVSLREALASAKAGAI